MIKVVATSRSSPFNDPLTFYSYPSPQRTLNLMTIEERLGIARADRYLPDPSPSRTASTPLSSSLSHQSASPPRTVWFLNQPKLTSEQEVLSSQHQTALIDAHRRGKQFRSRTSLPPDSARSLDSITSSLPIPQLAFGSITPIPGAAEVYISNNVYENRIITSTPYHHPDMSTTASTSQFVHFRAGLENRYDQSPMARLKAEYFEEQEQSNSVHTRATALASKKTLLSSDIVDRGSNRPRDTPCFHLIPTLYLDLHKTSNELQFFLQRTAGLIPERQTYFVVDPQDTFLTILNGAYDISQLHAAWMGISKRLNLGIKFIDKYESEYRETDPERRIKSPVSTDPGIIRDIAQIPSVDHRMRYLYSQVPHHRVELTEDNLRQFDELQQWHDIYPTPNTLTQALKSTSLPGTPLPGTPLPDFSHTSYKGGRQFVLPPSQPQQVSSNVDKGKNREFRRPSRPSGAAASLHMGPSTPWKSSLQFLDPPGSQRNPVPGIVPPDQGVEPNVLRGLGSINSGIWGDDRPLDTGHAPVYSGPQSGQPPISRPIRASSDPKDQQATSPVRGDAPSPNINNNPFPTGDHYRGHPPAGGYPGGGDRGNPFPGGGDSNPPGGGSPPGGGPLGNPFSTNGHPPRGFPSGPPGGGPPGGGPPGGGPPGDEPPGDGGIFNASGSSHNGGSELDLREYIPYGTNVPTIKPN